MNEHHAWVTSQLFFAYKPLSLIGYPSDGQAMEALFGQHSSGERYDDNAFKHIAKWDLSLKGHSKTLPDVFMCNGFTVLTGKAKDIFVLHDTGCATFHQLTLYEADGATLFSDNLFLLNLGDRKDALVPDESLKLRNAFVAGGTKVLPYADQRADDDVVLTHAALAGADIWTDPMIFNAVFFSDRLRAALRRARIDQAFKLTRCPIKP